MKYYVKLFLSLELKSTVILLLMNLLSKVLIILFPLLSSQIFDMIIRQDSYTSILNIGGVFLVCAIISLIMNYFNNVKLTSVKNKLLDYLVCKSLNDYLIKDYTSQEEIESGYLADQIISDSSNIVSFYVDKIIGIIFTVLSLITYLTIIIHINKNVFLLILAIVPIYILIFIKYQTEIYRKNYNFIEKRSSYTSKVVEHIKMSKYILSNRLHNQIDDVHTKAFNEINSTSVEYCKASSMIGLLFESVYSFSMVLILIWGTKEIYSSSLTIGNLMILTTYFGSVFGAVNGIMYFFIEYKKSLSSIDRISKLITKDKIRGEPSQKFDSINSIQLSSLLVLNSSNELYDNLDCSFKKGNIYLIKGKSGVGKTTLLKIILGIKKDYEGVYSVNNYNVESYFNYVENISFSVLFQETRFIGDTVSDTLKYCHEVNSEDKLLKNKHIMSLLNKDECFYNKKLISLSMGERRKVDLIATLTRESEVIILDEPGANLDKMSIDSLSKWISTIKDKIIIITSHGDYFDEIASEIIELTK